jgi:hypothetical protein
MDIVELPSVLRDVRRPRQRQGIGFAPEIENENVCATRYKTTTS